MYMTQTQSTRLSSYMRGGGCKGVCGALWWKCIRRGLEGSCLWIEAIALVANRSPAKVLSSRYGCPFSCRSYAFSVEQLSPKKMFPLTSSLLQPTPPSLVKWSMAAPAQHTLRISSPHYKKYYLVRRKNSRILWRWESCSCMCDLKYDISDTDSRPLYRVTFLTNMPFSNKIGIVFTTLKNGTNRRQISSHVELCPRKYYALWFGSNERMLR